MDSMTQFGDIKIPKNGVTIEPLRCVPGQVYDYANSSFPRVEFIFGFKKLRTEVTLFMLKRRKIEDENFFYDFEKFVRDNEIHPNEIPKYKTQLEKEIKDMGWKTKFSFGDMFFIYSTENPPPSCH